MPRSNTASTFSDLEIADLGGAVYDEAADNPRKTFEAIADKVTPGMQPAIEGISERRALALRSRAWCRRLGRLSLFLKVGVRPA
jgi:hypothetical protein